MHLVFCDPVEELQDLASDPVIHPFAGVDLVIVAHQRDAARAF